MIRGRGSCTANPNPNPNPSPDPSPDPDPDPNPNPNSNPNPNQARQLHGAHALVNFPSGYAEEEATAEWGGANGSKGGGAPRRVKAEATAAGAEEEEEEAVVEAEAEEVDGEADEEEVEVLDDEDDAGDDDSDDDGDDGDDGWWDDAVAEDAAAEATVATDRDFSGFHMAEGPHLSTKTYRAPECLLTAEEAVAQAAVDGLQLSRSLGESETGFLGVYTSSKVTPTAALLPASHFGRPRSKGRCPPARDSYPNLHPNLHLSPHSHPSPNPHPNPNQELLLDGQGAEASRLQVTRGGGARAIVERAVLESPPQLATLTPRGWLWALGHATHSGRAVGQLRPQ